MLNPGFLQAMAVNKIIKSMWQCGLGHQSAWPRILRSRPTKAAAGRAANSARGSPCDSQLGYGPTLPKQCLQLPLADAC